MTDSFQQQLDRIAMRVLMESITHGELDAAGHDCTEHVQTMVATDRELSDLTYREYGDDVETAKAATRAALDRAAAVLTGLSLHDIAETRH